MPVITETAPVGIPKTSDWGPILWILLHGGVEKMGASPIQSILEDQRREFGIVLKLLEDIIPCVYCRSHFHDYRVKSPIEKLPTEPKAFKIACRKWLYDLHEQVNQRNCVGEYIPAITLDMLPTKYSSLDLMRKSQELYMYLDCALRVRGIDAEAYKKFKRHYAVFVRYCF